MSGMIYVYDFLKGIDAGLHVVYWNGKENTDDFLWEGSLDETPWWIAELKLDYKHPLDHCPISYRDNLGAEYNNRPGFVILVEE